jgi:glycosyltransferase involved in cell wall biosynthesis
MGVDIQRVGATNVVRATRGGVVSHVEDGPNGVVVITVKKGATSEYFQTNHTDNPTVALDEVVSELERRGDGTLRFFGGEHPWSRVEAPHFERLVERLRRSSRVVVSGFQPFDRIVDEYRRAHVAVDLMLRNRERELAFTTRTVVYLWCGLPVIYNDYSELSTLIDEYDAGWTVDPGDRAAIRAAVAEAFDPELRERKSANARQLVSERLVWDATIAPLDAFVRRATMRPTARRDQEVHVAQYPTLLEKVRYVYSREGIPGVLKRSANPVRRMIRRAVTT